MRLLPTILLNPGMIIARAVYNSNGQVLLSAGTVLTDRFIKNLIKLGISRIYVADGFLPDVEVEDLILDETRVKAKELVKSFIVEVKSEGRITAKRAAIMARDMLSTVNEIVDQLLLNRSLMVNLMDIRTFDEYTFGHSVNVGVLSILTGITLGYNRDRLCQLGLGAVLHDLGKTMVPPEIINKPGPLTPVEFEEVKKHSIYGANLIKKTGWDGALIPIVALQHHERYNGQGYPKGMKGDEIHEFARIVAVADTYDAITADRVYKKAVLPHEAFEMMAGSGDYLYDFDIIKAFWHNIAAYPTGTIVELSTGEIGMVVETAKGHSLRPTVRLLLSPDGKYIRDYREIPLAESAEVSVVRVIEDIRELSFSSEQLG